ncbi:MAG: sigma-54-dependent Fis family transcriptional regulator [Deltaproteobacteria bacterium]|nr:sigma-54-dependent Fis family transcriptional regulator [Deltaproteobacteria bacterium]
MKADGTLDPLSELSAPRRQPGTSVGFVIVWSRAEPGRIGEIAVVPPWPQDGVFLIGRLGTCDRPDRLPLTFVRGLAGGGAAGRPLGSRRISREQFVVQPQPDGALLVENIGRCPLLRDGSPVGRTLMRPGDCCELKNEVILLVTEWAAPVADGDASAGRKFGVADAFGIVGESTAADRLRRDLLFAARHDGHVLIVGESGTGKELVARAIHEASGRGARPLIARNAATIPRDLTDAELFGNLRNYPNPGMPEHPGLIGEADGATLFLDEVGELPAESASHLLRVLDDGEYHRLGEATARRADFRLIAATNRPFTDLKQDLAARFPLRVEVPDLNSRREDIPLLVRHLMRGFARDPALAGRFLHDPDSAEEPRVAPKLVHALIARRYSIHVRELEQILWRAVAASTGDWLDAPSPESPGTSRAAAGAPDRRSVLPEDQPLDKPRRLVAAILSRVSGVTGGVPARRKGSAVVNRPEEGVVVEWSDSGRQNLFVHLPTVALRLLPEDAEFGSAGPVLLARILDRHPGVVSKRVRRKGQRNTRWWRIDVTGEGAGVPSGKD